MNMEFWEKHQKTSLEDAKKMFEKSHSEVLSLAEKYTNDQLFGRGVYAWVNTDLGSYFVSVMPSHYDWAMKKLKSPPQEEWKIKSTKITIHQLFQTINSVKILLPR